MRRMVLAAVAVGALAVLVGALETGADDRHSDRDRECGVAILRGAYGIQLQGTRPAPSPAPPGTIESVIGVIVRTYDGEGNFTQVGNEKGSVSGNAVVDREAAGTYQVNADCSGAHQWQLTGSPVVLNDRFVIVDRGREVRNFIVTPAPVMISSVSRKIGVP